MQSAERHKKILEILELQGTVAVEDLAKQFDISAQTIRADLRDLDQERRLIRFHGGARSIAGRENLEYEARRKIAAQEKVAIGIAAAGLIPNNTSLFMNIGTTTEAVSDALTTHQNLLVVTNNINVANNLRLYKEIDVVIAGGTVRSTDGAIVGETAVDFIKQFKVDYAIIGSSAIDEDGALLDFDMREVKVAQAIIENARNVIFVADSSKFGRAAPVRIAHLSQVDIFVTDKLVVQSVRQICDDSGVRVVEVG